jgi:hypothetical protein
LRAEGLGRNHPCRLFAAVPRCTAGHLAVELAGCERIRSIGRSERLVLDLSQLGVAGAVLALQVEVFANRVVEYAHDARVCPLSNGQSLCPAAHM